MVAGGHMTETPKDTTYSSVLLLKGLITVIFLEELKKMSIVSDDIGNAYLEAFTMDQVCCKEGLEFQFLGLEGHLLVIVKALYSVKSS